MIEAPDRKIVRFFFIFRKRQAREWRITDLRHETLPGGQRVSAIVEGAPVWFESSDAPLRPSAEGLATAFLIPALYHKAALHIDAPVDRRWMRNIDKLLPIFHEWWGYPLRNPVRATITDAPARPAAGAAACFTGGVDSFHTLLRSPHPIDTLLFIQGFDIALDDGVRMAAFEKSLRIVAAATGKHVVVVRTNLREHVVFGTVDWRDSHGTAIAAIGHLLGGLIGKLLIPSTYHKSDAAPWGSHWQTDPLLSSAAVEVIHDGADASRLGKTRSIADESLVREHLRVCWENRSPSGNCSSCEKCVRTMVFLEACGKLRGVPVFDTSVPLAERLDALPPITQHIRSWANIREAYLPPDIRAAVERLFARSGRG